ncbi:hypothetical protein V6246_06180 [Algibacter sp. TI.3.09]|uniref:hypothetical protein n=1 Tax=Algibacter sp. TI.3.09 TaxID=3121298 RepID=UPI0031204B8D
MSKLHFTLTLLLLLFYTLSPAQVGIGTTSPEAMLDVNGTFKLRSTINESDINIIKENILVTSSSGMVNTIMSSDVIDAALPTMVKASFSSAGDISHILSLGACTLQFNQEEIDNNNEFDTSTNTYTAKQGGVYTIGAQVKLNTSLIAVNTDIGIGIYKNGTLIAEQRFISVIVSIPLGSDIEVSSPIRSVTATTDLATGDSIEFKITAIDILGIPLSSISILGGNVESFCSIYQIR